MKRFANGRLEQHHHTRHHKHYLYWLGLLLCISFIVVIAACANLTEGTPSDDDLIDASTELDGQMMATFQQTLQQVTLADVAEAGVISLAQNHLDDWQTLTFSQSYVNPVVLMQPLSFKGGQPAMIRLRNVTATSAEFQIDEWEYLDGWHTQETVSYLVIEQGQHSLRGVEVEVGTVSADHQFFTHEFTSTFGTPPVVLSQVQTTNDGTAVVTRQQNVTEAGFAVRLQEQEAFDRGSERAHVPETVAYLAAEVGVGEGLELATQGGINHTWAALNFNNTYNAPIFLANLQTYAGGDTAGLRLRELASATGVEVKVEEEKSFDNEKNHAPEVVGWLVLEGAPTTSANMVVPQSQLLPAGTGALDFTVTTSQPATVKADLTDVPFGAMAYQGQASADGRSHQFSLPAQTDVPTTVTVRAVSQLTGEPLGEAAQINYRVVRDAPVTYPRLFTLWYPKFGNWADLTQEKLEALNVFIINLHGYGREDGYQPIDETLLRQARANNPELKLLTQFYSTYGCEGGETEFCDVLEAADADPMHPLFEQIYVRNADGSIWLYGPHPVYNFSNLDTVAFLLEQNLNLWHHDLLMFDGMFMDNCWRGFKGTNDGSGYDISTNIDLNLDGVADDPETRDRAFEHGLQDFLSGLRAAMPNALILCNSIGGRPDEQWLHNTGTPLSDRDGTAFNYADVIDGIEYEDALAGLSFYRDYYRSFAEVIGDYQAWNDQRDGVITMMPNKVVPDGSASDAAAYSDLRATRFGLAAALMGDGVFLHGGWGYYTWFDEYDVDLGAAVDDFGVPLPDNLVIWRREFEHGIALLNSSDDPVTVQLGDTFRALTGTQDPQVNNGELVTEMTLDGVDGRILLRTDEVIEPPSSVPPIIYLQSSISARPLDYTLLANINYVESLPFDGMVVNIPASWYAMSGERWAYEDFYTDWLEPAEGLFQTFDHNFLKLHVDKPGDFFDDAAWDITVQNWRDLARAAHDVGFKGIFFDNEEYQDSLWTYPEDMAFAATTTLTEYRAQARLRGQQVMQAVTEVFPDIEILVLHGPYVSEPATPQAVSLFQVGVNENDLRGDFFVGLLEAAGPQATVIDGGEVYQYRSQADFETSYQWRKTDIASEAVNAAFIPPALRSTWADKVDLSFGVYTYPWQLDRGFDMNPEIMETTLTHALRRADSYVWFYHEADTYGDWLTPEEPMQQDWINAVENARATAQTSAQNPTPPSDPVSSLQAVTYQASQDNFANPERGFLTLFQPPADSHEPLPPLSVASDYILAEMADKQSRLVRVVYLLAPWRNSAMPASFLDQIEDDFETARQLGVKLAPLFVYSWPSVEDAGQDASKAQILGHLEQLSPVLSDNADAMAFMFAGFVGPWGEWHDSSSGNLNLDDSLNDNSLELLDAIAGALPSERRALLRYPGVKQEAYGETPLNEVTAFSSTPTAQYGFHDECYLSDYHPDVRALRLELQPYLNQDSLYVPLVGIMDAGCFDFPNAVWDAVPCGELIQELEATRVDVANLLAEHITGNCLPEVEKRLGYRFRLLETTGPTSIARGSAAGFEIRMANDGFGTLYNPRAAELIFRHGVTGNEYIINLAYDEDPRLWLPQPGNETTLGIWANIPAELAPGDYAVFLNLPDAAASLQEDPNYSIRLANEAVWEADTGYNSLELTVTIF